MARESRWSQHSSEKGRFALGAVWRVAYPSHFDRDVLFCDLLACTTQERGNDGELLGSVGRSDG
jgi:hypothetical protein